MNLIFFINALLIIVLSIIITAVAYRIHPGRTYRVLLFLVAFFGVTSGNLAFSLIGFPELGRTTRFIFQTISSLFSGVLLVYLYLYIKTRPEKD